MRAIATFSVGADHIDLAAARARGITVTNTPDVLTEATADIAMLCLLGAARRAFEAEALVRVGSVDRLGPDPAAWASILPAPCSASSAWAGSARRSRGARAASGCRSTTTTASVCAPQLEHGAVFHDRLGALLPECRFLSLHCPGSAETRHMIDARALALLPRGAVLVNTARGTLLDDEAVLAALRDGGLFAAGLDVYAGEPDLHPGYRSQRNCFLLPHLGSATIETRNAMGFRCLDNLAAIFAGHPAPDAL